jgi:hypothetical protein
VRVIVSPADSPLLAVVGADLARSGKWATWCEEDPRLQDVGSLEEAVEGWRTRRDPRNYQRVAALASIGSRRGGDDDDAAMAVVVLLEPGIARLAARLRDVCEPDDVRATIWEEVKLAEPRLGNLAARHLLQRARQRLTRPSGGMVTRVPTVSLDQQMGWRSDSWTPGGLRGVADRCPEVATPEKDDPAHELAEVLDWAQQTHVVASADVDLILELVAAAHLGLGREAAQRLAGQRRGTTMRTIRRRRDRTLARLQAAAATYLATTG